jgi:formylglycine-generating enzyme required for sulfatase activity
MLDLKVAQASSLVFEDNIKNCQLRKLGYNYKVLRGGSWYDYVYDFFLRSASRYYDTPSNYSFSLGFRCAGLQ